MKYPELNKAKVFIVVKMIEFVAISLEIKTIFKMNTGSISAISNNSCEEFDEKISPFETFIQAINGNA
jgi:hypothetical protein